MTLPTTVNLVPSLAASTVLVSTPASSVTTLFNTSSTPLTNYATIALKLLRAASNASLSTGV